jgi:hypothetical protein
MQRFLFLGPRFQRAMIVVQVVTMAVAAWTGTSPAGRAFARAAAGPAPQDAAPSCVASAARLPEGLIAGAEVSHTVIEATAYEPFSIYLRTISGWRWQLAQPLDESVLRLVDTRRERFLDDRGDPLAGGFGEFWIFEPLCRGSVVIVLQYREPSGRVREYDVVDVVVR